MNYSTSSQIGFTWILIALTICLPSLVIANGLVTDLSIDPPENGYFRAGDSFTATLLLMDNDNNQLYADECRQNGLYRIHMYVSGPSDNYHHVSPYRTLLIVNPEGYHADAGFDPETGDIEIQLPDDLDEGGSYTIQFFCQRIVGDNLYSSFPARNFQVEQRRRTYTNSVRYLSCNNCHESFVRHGATELSQCVVCHARDFCIPFIRVMHLLGDHENQNCSDCHRAAADINKMARLPCLSCHGMPHNHENYENDRCAHCHSNGELSVYNAHDQPTPNRPESFDLIEPEDNYVTSDTAFTLSWEESSDNDDGDLLWYEIEISLENEFEDPVVFEVVDEYSFELNDLVVDTDYWWRVRAADLNSEGRYSSESRKFTVLQPGEVVNKRADIPTRISLLSPYPNPFNSSTTITYNLPFRSQVALRLYDLSGRLVTELFDGDRPPGVHAATLTAADLTTGLYFVRLQASDQLFTRKVMLIR